jgi:hypothetical protein
LYGLYGYTGNISDYQFFFEGGSLVVADQRRSAVSQCAHSAAGKTDGTDSVRAVEQLLFTGGSKAYVLGAGSENQPELSAEQILLLSPHLVVIGEAGEVLHLEGAWLNRGKETVGSNSFYEWEHENGNTAILVLDGVTVEPDLLIPILTPVAYWSMNEVGGRLIGDGAGQPQDGWLYGRCPDLDDSGPPASQAPFGAQTGADFHGKRSEYVAVAHDEEFELAEGTIQFWFETDQSCGRQGLLAKDHYGYGAGGHLSIALVNGRIEVRLQSEEKSYYICTDKLVKPGSWYHLAFSFGPEGMKLYLDGELAGVNAYTGGLIGNREPLVIGGTNWANRKDSEDLRKQKISNPFNGRIDEVAIFAQALTIQQVRQSMVAGPTGVRGA